MAKKESKANKKEVSKNKKSFTKDFKAELKKVIWPTPKQLLNNTIAVVTIVLVTAAIVFVLDVTFESLNKHGVNKVKEVISTNNSATQDNTTNETDNSGEEASSSNTENTENADSAENTENNAE
ncbi:MAG: preprotein translocase subunit SecE [Clostridia bacterium]